MIYIGGDPVQDFRFPDNTIRLCPEDCVFLKNNAKDYDRFNTFTDRNPIGITWFYEDPSEQVTLYALVNHLRERLGLNDIHLFMPYIPNARMDRTKALGGEVHMLKYFCKFINDLGFASVTVLDPHSDVSVSMLDRVIVESTADFVEKAVEESGAKYLFFPDDGAAKRYAPIYNFRPYLVGKKDRDWHTGTINKLVVENPMGLKMSAAELETSPILIVDDICSRGGTFLHAGIALQNIGFKNIDLCVTHCEKTIFAGKLLLSDSPIRHIYTTSSIFKGEHDKISVMDIDVL